MRDLLAFAAVAAVVIVVPGPDMALHPAVRRAWRPRGRTAVLVALGLRIALDRK